MSSQIALITFFTTVALIITAQLSRRNSDPHAKIHLLRNVLAVIVLALAATYFYMRFAG